VSLLVLFARYVEPYIHDNHTLLRHCVEINFADYLINSKYHSTSSDESYTVLGYYAASSGNSLPTFRDTLSVPSSFLNLKMGPTGCPETSIRNSHYSFRNNPEERSSPPIRCGSFTLHVFGKLIVSEM